jgi:hypothetical protein
MDLTVPSKDTLSKEWHWQPGEWRPDEFTRWSRQLLKDRSTLARLKTYSIWKEAVLMDLIPVLGSDVVEPKEIPHIESRFGIQEVYHEQCTRVIFFLAIVYLLYHDDPQLAPKVAFVPSIIRCVAEDNHDDPVLERRAFIFLEEICEDFSLSSSSGEDDDEESRARRIRRKKSEEEQRGGRALWQRKRRKRYEQHIVAKK